MSEITPQIAEKVVAACQANNQEIANALGRALNQEIESTCGEAASITSEQLSDWQEPGLVILLKFADKGMAAILSESSGMLPDRGSDSDPTTESKLGTLAQELSMLVVPEELTADAFQASRVENIATAIEAASVDEGAVLLPMELKSGDKSAKLGLLWPLNNPEALLPSSSPAEEPAEDSPEEESTAESVPPSNPSTPPSRQQPPPYRFESSRLPSYTRSLLKVKVPVRVVLASRKESVTDIVEIAAGSIIKFDKACDQPLHLYVGDQCIGEGEAVKVGDKFGFRLTTLLLPEEQFKKLEPKRAG